LKLPQKRGSVTLPFQVQSAAATHDKTPLKTHTCEGMPDWRATGQIVGTSQAGVPMLRSLRKLNLLSFSKKEPGSVII